MSIISSTDAVRRVLIVGSGGSGKSTLARQLGARLELPVVHLDQHYFAPGWVESPPEEWAATVEALIAEDAWVMDGNYGGTMEQRIGRADTVIFLDRSRWLCLWRVVSRWLRNLGHTRPDMAPGCPERVELAFVHYILAYPATRRPGVLARLAKADHARVHWLRSGRDVEAFLASVGAPARGL
ncbi:MAG: DNA topology modulation protein [Rubricoccaceae bacterium]